MDSIPYYDGFYAILVFTILISKMEVFTNKLLPTFIYPGFL